MEVEIWCILIFNVGRRIRITKCVTKDTNYKGSYYKVWQCSFAGVFDIFRIRNCGKVILLQSVAECYYKVRQVLQSMTVITKWDVTRGTHKYLKSENVCNIWRAKSYSHSIFSDVFYLVSGKFSLEDWLEDCRIECLHLKIALFQIAPDV